LNAVASIGGVLSMVVLLSVFGFEGGQSGSGVL
jgi:hypothetical protein